jgi:hypothetical protein
VTPQSARLTFAEVMLGEVAPETLPMWAALALTEGADTPALRELAGAPAADTEAARRLLAEVCAEVGVMPPTRPEARRLLVRKWATEIDEGLLPPEVGASRIWVQWSEAGADGEEAPEAWLTFVNDASDWSELPDRQPEITVSIRAAARRLVATTAEG